MMIRRIRVPSVRVAATAVIALVSGGCAMKGDIRTLQEELRAVAARQDSLMAELRTETLQTQDTLRTQGDQMFDLRGDINRQLQLINQSLVRIEALTGENQRGLIAVRDQLASGRVGGPGGGGGMVLSDSADAGGGESLVGSAGNADELWQVARGQLERGSLNSATRAFQQFIEEHPADERIPDAHFYLADILVQQERPEDALTAFQEIPQLFPTAGRVPDALYRMAVLQIELGDEDEARRTLERIVNTYPDAMISMLAREKLREIGG